jgi:hypothetical protein
MLLATSLPASAVYGDYFSISGRVTDANWNPIQGALVTLYDNEFNRITTQDTNENGYFAFEGVNVKTNLCQVRISYTDASGTYDLPGYFIPAITAHGDQHIDPKQTHYEDFYLPGSVPRVTPTPTPGPTGTPTDVPVPTESPEGQATQALIFGGGFVVGAVTAALACLIVFRSLGKI